MTIEGKICPVMSEAKFGPLVDGCTEIVRVNCIRECAAFRAEMSRFDEETQWCAMMPGEAKPCR